jgi:Trp operon repressor
VLLRAFTEQERLEVMIVENLQRDDLTPLEEAGAYQRLVEMKLTQREISSRVGRSQSHVAKRLALLNLPDKVKKLVDTGSLTLPDAQELAKIKDDPKLVAKVAGKGSVTNGGYGRGVSAQVEAELAKRDREKKYAAAVAKLTKAGKNVVDVKVDAYGYQVQLPEGMKGVKVEVYGGDLVQMKPADHAKLDCHAVGVNPRTLEVFEVCTTPKNHPSQADKRKAADDKRAAEQAKKAQEFDAMTDRRRQFVRELVAARIDKDGLLELLYLVLLHDARYYGGEDEAEVACDLAAIEIPEPKDEAEQASDDFDPDVLLEKEAAKSVTARLRVTFALAAATFESTLSAGHRAWSDELVYLEWLMKQGYKPSPEEKRRIADATTDAA